jgi:hypothetical protein
MASWLSWGTAPTLRVEKGARQAGVPVAKGHRLRCVCVDWSGPRTAIWRGPQLGVAGVRGCVAPSSNGPVQPMVEWLAAAIRQAIGPSSFAGLGLACSRGL